MTEQQNQSAVVEESQEAVETTPQPENTEKKKAGNKTTSRSARSLSHW